ncbi:MAG: hypothetical protein IJ849_09590 [Selenomonadaceae bacterium]|nr:hypothetical protein [Selenomonadaceae bacterium]
MKVTIIDISPEDLAAAPQVFVKLMESLQDITLKADTVNLETEPKQSAETPKAEEKKPLVATEKRADTKPKVKSEPEPKVETKPKQEPKAKAKPDAETQSEPKAETNEEATTEPKPEPKQKAENVEATPKDNVVEPPAAAPTLDEMKKRVMAIKKADGSKWDAIKDLITKYGAGKISAVPEDKRLAFMQELEAL